MTFCPLKSVSETLLPPLVATENSGALSPSFNLSSIAFAITVFPQITQMPQIGNTFLCSQQEAVASRLCLDFVLTLSLFQSQGGRSTESLTFHKNSFLRESAQ